jgi:hypothetical protein
MSSLSSDSADDPVLAKRIADTNDGFEKVKQFNENYQKKNGVQIKSSDKIHKNITVSGNKVVHNLPFVRALKNIQTDKEEPGLYVATVDSPINKDDWLCGLDLIIENKFWKKLCDANVSIDLYIDTLIFGRGASLQLYDSSMELAKILGISAGGVIIKENTIILDHCYLWGGCLLTPIAVNNHVMRFQLKCDRADLIDKISLKMSTVPVHVTYY